MPHHKIHNNASQIWSRLLLERMPIGTQYLHTMKRGMPRSHAMPHHNFETCEVIKYKRYGVHSSDVVDIDYFFSPIYYVWISRITGEPIFERRQQKIEANLESDLDYQGIHSTKFRTITGVGFQLEGLQNFKTERSSIRLQC